MLEGHGNDWYKYKGKLKADFSSNVWFQGPPKALLKHIEQNIVSIANYPEPHAQSLSRKVEHYYGLPQNSSLISNGSVEAFYLIAKLFVNKISTIVCPPFAEYEDASRQFNHTLNFIDNSQLNENTSFNTQLVWLCNPNNPDGKVIGVNLIRHYLKEYPDTTFIIDEAYADLCIDFKSVISLIKEFRNLIVVKSFTKSFAIPGLRLGIVLSNSDTISSLKTHLMPWTVNSLAQAAGSYIIENHEQLMFDKEMMQHLSGQLQKALRAHGKLEVTSSKTNYFLVRTKKGTAAELKEYLIQEHGFLIRDASNFRALSDQHFRIAIQNEENNNQLVKAIFQWLK